MPFLSGCLRLVLAFFFCSPRGRAVREVPRSGAPVFFVSRVALFSQLILARLPEFTLGPPPTINHHLLLPGPISEFYEPYFPSGLRLWDLPHTAQRNSDRLGLSTFRGGGHGPKDDCGAFQFPCRIVLNNISSRLGLKDHHPPFYIVFRVA